MAERQTMNVSLPPDQERFVRAMVAGGRYQTASEVIRDGLRMLEEAQHRRLLEKWLYEGLSDEERAQLPEGLVESARAAVRQVIDDGRRSGEEDGWLEREDVVARVARGRKSRRAKPGS